MFVYSFIAIVVDVFWASQYKTLPRYGDQKNRRRSSNMMPPQTTNASRPKGHCVSIPGEACQSRQDNEVLVEIPIHVGEIGDLNAFISFVALSGFPLFAAS